MGWSWVNKAHGNKTQTHAYTHDEPSLFISFIHIEDYSGELLDVGMENHDEMLLIYDCVL